MEDCYYHRGSCLFSTYLSTLPAVSGPGGCSINVCGFELTWILSTCTFSPMTHAPSLSISFVAVGFLTFSNIFHLSNNPSGKKWTPLRIKIIGNYYTSFHQGEVPLFVLRVRHRQLLWPATQVWTGDSLPECTSFFSQLKTAAHNCDVEGKAVWKMKSSSKLVWNL